MTRQRRVAGLPQIDGDGIVLGCERGDGEAWHEQGVKMPVREQRLR